MLYQLMLEWCGAGRQILRAQNISIYSKVENSEAKSIIKKDAIVAGTME